MGPMDSDSYESVSTATKAATVQHGAGANPSTAAGLVVLIALGGLLVIRRSFRSFT